MDLNQLRSAVALAEEASFSRAAARLGVAQPSLSQQIKKLESDVGRPLFDRLPRRVVPTQTGQRLIEHARAILAQLADAQRQVQERDGEVAGPLTVGAIPTIAPFLLPAVLTALASQFPQVELRVVEDVTDRLIEMVERGELDVAIISSHEGSRTVHVEPIATEPLLLMLGPGHRLAARRSVTWQQLAGERFLVLHEMHCLSGQVSRVCDRRSLRPPVVMRGAQLATIAAMVCAGLGVSIVPEMMRLGDPPRLAPRAKGRAAKRITARPTPSRADGCVYLPFANDAPRRELAAAWSLLRYRTNASRAMIDLLRATLRGKPAMGKTIGRGSRG